MDERLTTSPLPQQPTELSACRQQSRPSVLILMSHWNCFPRLKSCLSSDDPSSDLSASISTTLVAGTYYVAVSSSGGYGEIGVVHSHRHRARQLGAGTCHDCRSNDRSQCRVLLDVTLSATDADSDPVTFSAAAVTVDSAAVAAYQLSQECGLFASSSEFLNFRGQNEKYLQGADDNWFYVLPDGEVYLWGGSIAASTLLDTLSADYYNDLSLLYDAAEQPYKTFSGTVSVSGTTLTIDPDAGLTGTYLALPSAPPMATQRTVRRLELRSRTKPRYSIRLRSKHWRTTSTHST